MERKLEQILLMLEKLESDITEIKVYLAPSRKVSPSSASVFPLKVENQTGDISDLSQLTGAQISILERVRLSSNGVTAEDLREQLGYRSRATVSHNLNDLVRLGLLGKKKGERTYYFIR